MDGQNIAWRFNKTTYWRIRSAISRLRAVVLARAAAGLPAIPEIEAVIQEAKRLSERIQVVTDILHKEVPPFSFPRKEGPKPPTAQAQ